MKYPQNKEDAKAIIAHYDNLHSNGDPDLSICIENTWDEDNYDATHIEFYKDVEECHDAHVLIKHIDFEIAAYDDDCPCEIALTTMSIEDFLAAAETIKTYADLTKKKGGDK